MHEATVSPLIAWATFYVIIGTAAAVLTGLMFVVVTLIAGARLQPGSAPIAAFNTPNVVHFCLVLLVAAILSAPWPSLGFAAVLLGLIGLGGVSYASIVLRRLRHQTTYAPVLEDWLWHVILPLIAYAALVIAAMVLPDNSLPALFVIGAVTILLVFSGIHNAWDNVTYLVTEFLPRVNEGKDE
ncbi:MAG: hypothetical protein ACXVDA_19200 [Ktedonobacterales bacterium]